MATVIVSNVMLFAPFALYAGNPDEFSVSLPAILTAYAAPALIVVIVLGVMGWLMPASGFPRYLAFLTAFPILMWIQGTFLVWDYGALDGARIPWLKTAWRGAIDTSLWLAVLLTALYGYRRFGKLMVRAATVTFVIQLIAVGTSAMSGAAAPTNLAESPYDEDQYQAMFGFSPEKNVFHVVMDGFQSDIFAEIIDDPQHKQLADSLTGFTFFDQNTGTFPYTQMTVPLIVSGQTYLNDVPVDQFTEETMRGTTTLNLAKTAGFEVDIAAQVPLRKIYATGEFTNTYDIPSNRHASKQEYVLSDAVRMLDLSLFRLAPHFVKAYIYKDELWFVQSWFRSTEYLTIRYFSELTFLDDIAHGLRADREKPVYKLFHLMLSHRPTVGNQQCEFDGIRDTLRSNVTIQARCGLSRVVDVLEAMKRIGVYDNTLIVLMADHGAWVGAEGYVVEGDTSSNSKGGPTVGVAGMAVPVLAIKPPASVGPMKVSSAPTTLADVPATIASLIGLDPVFDGRNVFQISASESRTRTFFNYAYGKNQKVPGYLYTMIEYEISGSPFDYESWRKVGTRRPEGITERVEQVTLDGTR